MVKIREFKTLPLGTLFKFPGDKKDVIWVIINTSRCGIIAKWDGVDGPVGGQVVCGFADTEEECNTGEVEVVRRTDF